MAGWTSPEPVSAREQAGRIEDGLSRPMVVSCLGADDRRFHVVLKLRNPPQGPNHHGPTSLACELLCAMIGRRMGLPVPDYFVVDVSEDFVATLVDEDDRALLACNVGPCFGTRLIEGAEPWDEDARAIGPSMMDALEQVLSFDASVFNPDRCLGNSNLVWTGRLPLYLIDHSLAAPAHLWPSGSSPLLDGRQVSCHACRLALLKRGRRFDSLNDAWSEAVDPDTMSQARDMVPTSWETRAGDLDRVFDFLTNRAVRLQDVAKGLREIMG